ncbi:adaptor complex subunit medium chain 3 [Dacryopinax primogenitus]|uniref:Adaptor complex subunit medium chain 3 n=1 Tax=Dacryopinax primogenitus (strain DJM 731) TaxID=1858805 RepID=M5G1U4_DACPD|nr:adaptor complex subunit medium chain 3 [Dacryopinax primogenitus]EJT97707.1 adaptor complex subunit medium chain 3 [Dacryopinax primogenitus]
MPLPSLPGLIILDSLGKPIIQTTFRTTPPAFPLLHIGAFNDALSRASEKEGEAGKEGVENVLYVPGAGGKGSALCWKQDGDLRFLCPVNEDLDPLFVFSFLNTFLSILRDYIGDISASRVRDNFDLVYQLLEEMLDSGHPLTTEPNALRDIVLPPSLLNKLLSAAGASSLPGSTTAMPFASPIPWRRPGVRYNNNEVYFDIVEQLEAIVGRNGAVLSGDVWGEVKCQCRLSGTPDLLLTFSNSRLITEPSFHPCIRFQRWTRDRALSFVPPDGHFTLLNYMVAPPPLAPHQVPLQLRPHISIGTNTGSFEIVFVSRAGKTLEDVKLLWPLGEGATSVQASMSSANGPANEKDRTSWGLDPLSKSLEWRIPVLPASASLTLKGTFSSSETHPRTSPAIQITYTMSSSTISGLKVESLKLVGAESYKPFKGVRGSGRGNVEWRW